MHWIITEEQNRVGVIICQHNEGKLRGKPREPTEGTESFEETGNFSSRRQASFRSSQSKLCFRCHGFPEALMVDSYDFGDKLPVNEAVIQTFNSKCAEMS